MNWRQLNIIQLNLSHLIGVILLQKTFKKQWSKIALKSFWTWLQNSLSLDTYHHIPHKTSRVPYYCSSDGNSVVHPLDPYVHYDDAHSAYYPSNLYYLDWVVDGVAMIYPDTDDNADSSQLRRPAWQFWKLLCKHKWQKKKLNERC